jgi:hypothetical protein
MDPHTGSAVRLTIASALGQTGRDGELARFEPSTPARATDAVRALSDELIDPEDLAV